MLTRKQITPLLILAAATFGSMLLSSQKARPNPPAPSPAQTGATKIVAYYFHTTARCATCLAIENYSREVVERKFGADIAKGRLEYRLVNVQLPENQHFIKDYQLFTKSVVLVRFDKGRQAEYKVLNETWELARDKSAMQGYVEREVRDYLKRLS
jgi:hypothetical protein